MKRLTIFLSSLVLALFLYSQNNALGTTHYTINTQGIFKGYKILQISDLHNKEFGRDSYRLIKRVKREQPDIIVITGDLIDSRNTNMDMALIFVKRALEIAPVYYVPGNHEARITNYPKFAKDLEKIGVDVLHNDSRVITKNNERVKVYGVKDPAFIDGDFLFRSEVDDSYDLKILLSHRPELFPVYVSKGYDLVFTGHAHGGQFRLPFIGGLYAPNQGKFPKYTKGIHLQGSTKMVVSRGLGNSLFPLRLFNRPEIVLVTFE